MRPHLDLLVGVGATVLIYAETSGDVHGDRSQPLSRRPLIQDEDWAEFGRRITALAERTFEEGVRLVFHHHMGTAVQSRGRHPRPHAVHRRRRASSPRHRPCRWGGADPVGLAQRYRDRIGHVHAKDVRREVMERSNPEDWSFLDAVVAGVYTVPGDGTVNFPAVLRELRGYSGWIVVEAEQDPEKANPYTYAKMGYDNLTRYLREAGLS